MVTYSDELIAALTISGWYSGRRVDISEWLRELHECGYDVSEIAMELLATFGGLILSDPSMGRLIPAPPVTIDPMLALDGRPVLWENKIGTVLTPLGERSDQSVIYVSPSGAIFGHYDRYFIRYGDDLASSFTNLVLYNCQFATIELDGNN